MEPAVNKQDRKYKFLGLSGTLAVHGLLILFFLTFILKTKIPPFPEGGGGPGMGIEVNLGYSDEGMGGWKEEIAEPAFKEAVKPATATVTHDQVSSASQSNEDKYLTQDSEDNPVLPEGKSNKPAETKTRQPVVNPSALYTGKKSQQGTQANEGITGKPGNQGKPNGSLYSKNYNGTGGEGSGGGTGGGIGTGTGNGTGDGISFDLIGRKAKELIKPPPPKGLRDVVYVVVRITVNKKGEVTNAVPGIAGTSTTNQGLWKLAQEAALKARFDARPEAAVEQKGTIKFKFVPH